MPAADRTPTERLDPRSASPRARPTLARLLAVGLALLMVLLAGSSAVLATRILPHGGPATVLPAPAVVNDGITPQPLAFASGAYDALDGYVVMFGGQGLGGDPTDATWIFSHENWSALTPVDGIVPPARYGATLTYDAAAGYLVLFGGCGNSACTEVLNDTWTFAHGAWTNVTSAQAVSPPARWQAMAAFDASDGYLLLFGGQPANLSQRLGDTWTFDGGHWNEVPPGNSSSAPGPSARAGGILVFDAAQNRTILFGGASTSQVLSDTWTYRGGAWTNLTSLLLAPGPRWLAAGAYDSTDQEVLLVNGVDEAALIGETWGFTSTGWVKLPVSDGPDPSEGALLVDDPGDHLVLYFSGIVSGPALLTSTLTFSGGSWTLLINPPGSPVPHADLVFLLILFLLFVPLVFIVLFPVTYLLQRRRERSASGGVQVVPGEIIRWIPTPEPWKLHQYQAGGVFVFVLLPALFLASTLPDESTLTGVLVLTALVVIVYGLLVGFLLVFNIGRLMNRAVATVEGGVIVRRSAGELRVAWDCLRPSQFPPSNGRFFFHYTAPGGWANQGGFVVTLVQARAIFLDPRAPGWVLSRSVTDLLQLPPRIGRPPGIPPPPNSAATPGWAGPASAWAGPWSKPPAGPSPLPAGGTNPSTNGGGWGPIPPPPPRSSAYGPVAPLPPPPPPPPPAPPPGLVACRRCGQFNPIRQVAFCRSCGQRLG